jgi:hypothetical protein
LAANTTLTLGRAGSSRPPWKDPALSAERANELYQLALRVAAQRVQRWFRSPPTMALRTARKNAATTVQKHLRRRSTLGIHEQLREQQARRREQLASVYAECNLRGEADTMLRIYRSHRLSLEAKAHKYALPHAAAVAGLMQQREAGADASAMLSAATAREKRARLRRLDVRPPAAAGGDAATRLAARLAGASPPKASTAEVVEGEFPPLPPSGLRFAPTPTPEALGRRVGNAACEAVLRAAAAERATQPAPRALGAAAAADDDDASARALLTVLRRIGAALEAQRDLSLRLAPRPLEEVLLMADFLGVPYGGDRGSELLWIADAALCSELPLGWAEHVTDDGTPYYHSLWSTKVMWEHPQRAWLRGVATAAREGAALLAHTAYT